MPTFDVQLLNHREPAVAEAIHVIQMAAYAQEASLLGAKEFPPLDRIVRDIQSSSEQFFGALTGSLIVGALGLESLSDADGVNISSLVVLPSWQRQGIGRLLLSAVLAELEGREIHVSTGAKNGPALALYAAFSFVERSRRFLGPERLEVVHLFRDRSDPVPANVT
jgi:ribosomal protein S18 acetylase RimI-like enzyme